MRPLVRSITSPEGGALVAAERMLKHESNIDSTTSTQIFHPDTDDEA